MSRRQVIFPGESLRATARAGRAAGSLRSIGGTLLFLLAAVGGEWVVHQVQYLIEYGSRFGAEMASTPHRLYMGPLGGVLALAAVLALALAAVTLQTRAGKRRWLLRHLPARLHRAAAVDRPRVSMRQVRLIAILLLTCQIVIYLTQENVEALARGLSLPGLGVVFSATHWTVLPLHLLLAVANAVVLATLSAWLTQSRKALRAVEVLVRLMTGADPAAPILGVTAGYIPSLRLSAGRLGLRSPPLR